MGTTVCKIFVSKEFPMGSQQSGVLQLFRVANSALNCGYCHLKRREIFRQNFIGLSDEHALSIFTVEE
jgi:hypothetical protein